MAETEVAVIPKPRIKREELIDSEESNASDSEDDIPKKRPTPRKQLLVDSDDE